MYIQGVERIYEKYLKGSLLIKISFRNFFLETNRSVYVAYEGFEGMNQ